MPTRMRHLAKEEQAPKKGMTSVEAAALLLSEGKTTDPVKAQIMAEGQDLNMDALQRAALRRAMGFDFKLKVRSKKIMVMADDGSHLRANCKLNDGDLDDYGNIINKDVIERLVQSCLVLKQKWDAKQEKANVSASKVR